VLLDPRRASRRSRISRRALAAFFVGAGALHFVKPRPYEAIVPPALPLTREIVYVSGVAEIVGGLGVLSGRLRPWAGWWLIALLVAVFPANFYHAIAAEDIPGNPVPRPMLWARLPLQALLIAWVWKVAEPGRSTARSRAGRTKKALRRWR
jgi:uncharacterized membrane protein